MVYVNHEYKGVFKITVDREFKKLTKLEKIEELGKGIGSDITDFKGKIFYSKRDAIYVKTSANSKFVKHKELSNIVASGEYTSGTFIKNDGYLWLFNSFRLNLGWL